MRVLEEPFLTRESILSVYRLGEVTTDRPFRTLGQRQAASRGLSVVMRTALGQMLGRVHLYSVLNADAARAYRLRQADAARALAARAGELEQSPAAAVIQRAIALVAGQMPAEPLSDDAPATLRRYLEQRRRSSWRGLNTSGLAREWLVQSAAWLTPNSDELIEAVSTLGRDAAEARSEILDHAASATTFFGIVQRMDDAAVEIEATDGETMLLPRADLNREGLAVIGQPISLLREALPGGGSYWLPMPAVAVDVDSPRHVPALPLMDIELTDGMTPAAELSPADRAWVRRELARNPRAVPAAPLAVSD